MARSATQDVYDKFRFKIVVLDLNILGVFPGSPPAAFNSPNLGQDENLVAGFSEVAIPKATVAERTYRENIDPLRRIKAPGLVSYEPISLRKGKTEDRSLYNWYKKLNDDANSIAAVNGLLASQNFIPVFDPEYRKDVVIHLLDREGTTKKAWFVFNAWPSGYQGGNDFSSSAEEKLIEELTLSYESFVEIPDDKISTLTSESTAAAQKALAAGVLASLIG